MMMMMMMDEHHQHGCAFCGLGTPIVSCVDCSESFEPIQMCMECDQKFHEDGHDHDVHRLESEPEPCTNEADAAHIIGLVGHPNVGKSSVLNALAGKKLVSVSHTPGHTKKLQTIWISNAVCLCDCPGLVFPYTCIPRYLQELCGLYPFAQIKEPVSAVRFLAESFDLEAMLNLEPRTQQFDGMDEKLAWTPFSVCEAYAEKKKYQTDRRGRPDYHRAGVELIRDCVDGIFPLFFFPPDYCWSP